MNLADDLHVAERVILSDIDFAVHRLRDLRSAFTDHVLWEPFVQHLDDLIANGEKLKTERAALLVDRDAQKTRADKAESALATLQAQVAADEDKAAKAAADLETEIEAESVAPAPDAGSINAVVTTPTPANSTIVPVANVVVSDIAAAVSTAATTGTPVTVTGDAIAPGTTVTSVDTAASTITLDTPTTTAHVGDGTEALTITVPAAS